MNRKPRTNGGSSAGSDPPTSRDGIETWLDVLTSMLSLPPSQRTQVRDELEDHLRSRVDDLLIQGKSEPQAIQTAIAELGETAQLARHISSANRTPKSFRRFAMNATFFVLAGSVLTASVSMMMPKQTVTSGYAAPLETPAAEVATIAQPLETIKIDVRDGTIGEMVKAIESGIDRPLIVHWDLLNDLGFEQDSPINIDSAPINAQLVLTILAERAERDFHNSIAVLESTDRMEIGTRSQFDRRTREERIYDLSMFDNQLNPSSTRDTMQQVLELLQSHVSSRDWANRGGDIASATVLNTTLVVSAPERMHEEIQSLLSDLFEEHEAQLHVRQRQKLEAVDRVRYEYLQARERYLAKSKNIAQFEIQVKNMEQRLDAGKQGGEEDEGVLAELAEQRLQLKALRIQLQEDERRYQNLQSLLLDTEREQLMSELD